MKLLLWLAPLCLLAPTPLSAASSDWFETEGARLRLVTEEAAGPDGTLRGALVIELEDGWKTYWKDPGDAGIAPQLDVSTSVNVDSAAISFPAPGRYGEGADVWAGYSGSVSLPLTFRLSDPQAFTAIDADLFLGVCRDLCIPVQARLSVLPGGDATVGEPLVAQAFAALPAAATSRFGAVSVVDQGSALRIEATAPDAARSDLFVASPPGWVLRAPERDGTSFVVPVAARPDGASAGTAFDYTLVSGSEAVEGTVHLP